MEHDMTMKGFFGRTTTIITLALFVTSMTFQALYAKEREVSNRVYRWVDENGDVHYTESLPPDYEGETHDELSHDGIVRDSNVSLKPPPPKAAAATVPEGEKGPTPEEIAAAQKQEQLDRLLLLRYQSEAELLEARDVEVNQLKYDERLLTATHESLSTSLRSNIVLAGHRQRAGLEIKPETLNQIASIRARLEQNESSLRGLKVREDQVREKFEEQLQRYREMVELYSEDT
jgi:hypothetical protein